MYFRIPEFSRADSCHHLSDQFVPERPIILFNVSHHLPGEVSRDDPYEDELPIMCLPPLRSRVPKVKENMCMHINITLLFLYQWNIILS